MPVISSHKIFAYLKPHAILLLIFVFGNCIFGFSQISKEAHNRFSFNNLTVNDGLSQNSVVSIAQDSTGFLWFATQDGLNKYDGRKFTIYKEQFEDVTRPSYSKLGKVFIDSRNTLWAITNPGTLKYYDRPQEKFQRIQSIDSASLVYEDTKRNIFIGTYGQGLFKIKTENQDTIQVLDETANALDIYDLIEHEDRIWIAGTEGVYKLEERKHNLDTVLNIPNTNFSSFAKNREDIYVGSYQKGLFIKSGQSERFEQFKGFEKKEFPSNLVIQDLLVDKYERLWVATYGQGLYIIDFSNKDIRHFVANKNNPNALHYQDILFLFQDFSGTVWLGTDGAGLSYYDEYLYKFNSLTNNIVPDDIHVDVIRAIAVDNNDLWLGTSGKGLTKINLETQKSLTKQVGESNLAGDRIMSLYHDGEVLWVGHQEHGLQKLNQNTPIQTVEALAGHTIWKIHEAPNDQLWLCTRNNGLILFDKHTGVVAEYHTRNSVLTSNNIRTIERFKDRSFWIGTEQDGLFLLNLDTREIIKIDEIPDKIKSLYQDEKKLWIGTNGNGLKSFDPTSTKVLHFTTEDGLPNNVIYGILPDKEGDLWLSSNRGITKFFLKENQPIIENYENYDGLQSYEFNTGAYFRADDGTLYFGGLEGLNWFRPEQLQTNPSKPKTVITNIRVFNATRDIADKVPLKHTQNTITFTYSSLQFSQPNLNQYKYRLMGYDDDWVPAGNDNEVRYTNLSPGRYTFQVLSSNYDGIWGERPATYDFEIEQPWHFTNMAIAVFSTFTFQGCFIAIGVFMLLLYFRLRKQDYLLYGIYILIFASYFFLRINLELQLGLFFKDHNTTYYFMAPMVFLLSGVFIAFVNSFAEIKSYNPAFSKELKWFAGFTYLAGVLMFLYILISKDFTFVKSHMNLVLLPLHVYGIYAVIRAFIVVKSPLRYYILLGNIFLIGFSMVGVYYGSQNAFSGSVESNNVFGFYSFNITQLGVFLELLVFSMGLGHKFYYVEIEKNRFQKIDELKTKLYTDISHEIRTPLTLISGPIENQLRRTGLSDKDQNELTLIKNNANRLMGLVDQMLDLSMIDSGQLKLNVEQDDLKGLLIQLVEAFSYLAEEQKIKIKYDFKDLSNSWFDRDVVEKIISNLLSNAVKYAPEHSEVFVNAEKNEGSLVFSVVNNTKDIGIDDLSKLFTRFHQNHEGSEGVGVGLALVRELVSLSNGSIIANNIGEDKIQFTLTLPISPPALETAVSSRATKQKINTSSDETTNFGNQKNTTILIVEDDKDIQSYLVSIFNDQYTILTANNGEEGWDIALDKLPDLIISDIMMPLKNGVELCRDIKSNELTSHIPVVLLTAKAGEENQLTGFKTGADAYVTKPFKPKILKLRVENLLENRKQLQKHYSKTFKVEPGLVPTSTEGEFVKRLQKVLDHHITSPEFTSEKFSKLMLMSRSQLHKKLHAITGMSTTEFVRTQRINLAKELLSSSDTTISEIAYQVGFNTPSYFNKCFKDSEGCTPNEYLHKYK
ncbi:two-component regulator propeller domain-containing protein [Allomuricauda sp. F6463D]|uniref:two-component regulator propeller domain-containing protein n=1 Tax=Allomuricauda sp. F6463D TaxID=2926409 RepID=UPI001FF25BF1|nr:two-component regulator propeller domain-containing protein [Muricauda sp. F6463D]MCK0159978.1 response regulator [Muricauda sp. F6463D]